MPGSGQESREKMAHYPAKDSEVSGYITKQTVINMQHWLRKVGYYAKNRECDGVWGYWTTLGIQQYLRTKYKGGYPRERYYAGRLDGQFGSMTKGALGDAAYYLVGGRPGSKMYQYCGGYSCHVAWPNIEVVKNWQYFLNNAT